MNGLAIVCSGQGGQRADMFDAVATAPEAEPIFAAARRILDGCDPRHIVRRAEGDIHKNEIAQVLCCTSALAWWAVLRSSVQCSLIIAGYSAGEVPAWGVTGTIDIDGIFGLVKRRSALMDEATLVPSGLAAVLGLPRRMIDSLCQTHNVDIAIINGAQHVIVGGPLANLKPALTTAVGLGASRAVLLPIHVAAHTPYLRTASDAFLADLCPQFAGTALPGNVRLLSGIDGMPVLRISDGLAKLAAQIATTVNWAACMEACLAAGARRGIELGPGNALARMMTEAAPGLPVRSVADFQSIDGVRRWLSASY